MQKIINALLILAVIGIALFLFSQNLHHNGAGAEQAGKQLNTAAGNQQQATKSLGAAAAGAKKLDREAERGAEEERTAGAIIAECQQILGDIRQRGERETQ